MVCNCRNPNPNCPFVVLQQYNPRSVKLSKISYFSQCKKFHPDRVNGTKHDKKLAKLQFMQVMEAWDRIKNLGLSEYQSRCPFQLVTKPSYSVSPQYSQSYYSSEFTVRPRKVKPRYSTKSLLSFIAVGFLGLGSIQYLRYRIIKSRVEKQLEARNIKATKSWEQAKRNARLWDPATERERLESHAAEIRRLYK